MAQKQGNHFNTFRDKFDIGIQNVLTEERLAHIICNIMKVDENTIKTPTL